MDDEENKQPRLTDEEVWLRAYCAVMSNDIDYTKDWKNDAEFALKEFKERFRND